MLQTFRVIINSLVGKVFFGILVLTFGLLGVGYGFRDLLLGATTNNDAAVVGGVTITLNDLDQQYRRQLQDYQRRTGGSFNPTAQQKQAIVHETLNQAINDALFAQQAREAGFRIGDTTMRKIVESQPDFAGEDRRFDAGRFRMALEQQGMTEATYIPMVRAFIARQLLINPIATSATAPKFLVDDIYRYRNEQRVAQTVTILNTAATGIAAPTDADIDAYYKKHAADFTAPEYRTFSVLPLTPELFAADIKPTDDELHTAYDQHKADYIAAEKRKITQLDVPDKATGEAVVKAMETGKSMAEAAKAAINGKVQPIALDFLPKDTFPEELREPVFTASKGAPIGPIQTLLGWKVVEVDDIQAGHQVAFDDVKAKLTEEIKHDAAIDRLSEQVDKLGDRLTGGASMDDVGAGVGAKTMKFGPIDEKGDLATPDPKAAKAAAQQPAATNVPGGTEEIHVTAGPKPTSEWVSTAFQTQQGETSAFQDDKKGGYYAVRVDSITPPALRPLADVRAQIVTGWTKEQQAAQVTKRAEELVAKARAGAAMTDIAASAGVKLESSPPVTRDPTEKPDPATPPALRDALFKLDKVGDITTIATDNGQIVARLSEIRAADPRAAGAKLPPIAQELDGAMRADSLAQYREGLRQNIKVKINPQAVETVAGQ